MSSSCCAAGVCEELPELADLQDDPTLMDCCARDRREQRHVARVKGQLLAVDPTQARQRAAAQVMRQDCASPAPSWAADSGDSDLSDAEDVPEAIRAARLAELHARARTACGGRGLEDCSDSSLQKRIRHAEAAVCHLAGRPTQASQELDEILAVLAKKYQSTVFLRLPLQGSQLPELLGLPSQDGLLGFVDDCFTAHWSAPELVSASGGELSDSQVQRLLRRQGLLRPERDALSDSSSNSEGEDVDPCTVCGRTYPHVHVARDLPQLQPPDSDSE